MRIISKAAILEFSHIHSGALEALRHWYYLAKRATWNDISEVRNDFRHADAVGPFAVFNIGGNKYRLIAIVKYRWQTIYVRHILTHAEYNEETWKQ